MRFAIIVFPGSNCDHDAYKVIESIDGAYPKFVWHRDNNLSKYDCIIVPGGFSYGDYLRAGAIARFSPIMDALISESNKGKKIVGICNGFQILLEAELLEGSLINNKGVKFKSTTCLIFIWVSNMNIIKYFRQLVQGVQFARTSRAALLSFLLFPQFGLFDELHEPCF